MADIEIFVIFSAKSIIDAMKIIGRNAEISELERLRDSGRSEFDMISVRLIEVWLAPLKTFKNLQTPD